MNKQEKNGQNQDTEGKQGGVIKIHHQNLCDTCKPKGDGNTHDVAKNLLEIDNEGKEDIGNEPAFCHY